MVDYLVFDQDPNKVAQVTRYYRAQPSTTRVTDVVTFAAVARSVIESPPDLLLIGARTATDQIRRGDRSAESARVTFEDGNPVTLAELYQRLPVLAFGVSADGPHGAAAVGYGARGFLSIAESVLTGEIETEWRLLRPQVSTDSITPRELEILVAMSEGRSNDEIGIALGIATNTVKSHQFKAFRKLGAKNRAHAVAIALHAKLIA